MQRFGLPGAVPSQEVAAEKIRSAIKEGGHVAMYQTVHCSVAIGDGQVNPITKGLKKSNYEDSLQHGNNGHDCALVNLFILFSSECF